MKNKTYPIITLDQKKIQDGKGYHYDISSTLDGSETKTLNHAFITNDSTIHLKPIDIFTDMDAVTVELREGSTITANTGSEVAPISSNRKFDGIKRFKDFIFPDDITVDTPINLKQQPADGNEPVIDYVRNGTKLIHPDVAIEIAQSPIDAEEPYGILVHNVAQVDNSKQYEIVYTSKQDVDTLYQQVEDGESYLNDALIILDEQDYDEAEPTILRVYCKNVELTKDTDFELEQVDDSGDPDHEKWGIKLLETDAIDVEEDLIIVYSVEKETNVEFSQMTEPFSFFAKLTVGDETGFEADDEITQAESEAKGKILAVDTTTLYVEILEGEFVTGQNVVVDDSDPEVSTSVSAVALQYFIAFENQSYDDTAITSATMGDLSFTQDYVIDEDDGDWRITLRDTTPTDASKPLVVMYQVMTLFAKPCGSKLLEGVTVTEDGELVNTWILPGDGGAGQSSIGSEAEDAWETILRPNTNYTIKVNSENAGKVFTKLKWYTEG